MDRKGNIKRELYLFSEKSTNGLYHKEKRLSVDIMTLIFSSTYAFCLPHFQYIDFCIFANLL